jgi:hypothetical protein
MEFQRALLTTWGKLNLSGLFLIMELIYDYLQTVVSITPLYFLYDESIFPSPTTYNPARWLVGDDEKREMLAHFHPFSRGTRQCIGQK